MLSIWANGWPFVISICIIVRTNIVLLQARYSKLCNRNLTDMHGLFIKFGIHGVAVGWGTATSRQVAGSISMVSLEFFIDIILPFALCPWSWLNPNRNENQEYFLEGKGCRCVGMTTLPPSYAEYLEIWESQTPETLRACPGLYRDFFNFIYEIYDTEQNNIITTERNVLNFMTRTVILLQIGTLNLLRWKF
jgi:hypothetical protein